MSEMADEYGLEYDFPHDPDYQAAKVKLAIAGMLADRMAKLGMNRTQLAQRLNVSAARVTQILAGYSNLTIDTLVTAALALDSTAYFELLPMPAGTVPMPCDVGAWSTPDFPPQTPQSPQNLALAA